jgi:ABC-type branched-subunit amino acid transport system substrate-binding protein
LLGRALIAWGLIALSACSLSAPPPSSAPLTFLRGEHAFERGDYARAIDAYRAFLKHPSDEIYVPRAWYKVALSQFQLKQYRAALTTLDELRTRYPESGWPQASALRGDIHQALGNSVSALQAWAEAWRIGSESQRQELRPRFDRVIEKLSDTERERAREVITDPTIRKWIDRPPAPPRVAQPPEHLPALLPPPRAALLPSPAPLRPGAQIACLLPLSGKYRAFGERSLRGIQLVLGTTHHQLLIRDTQGEAEPARAAFAEVATRTDVVGVIGPLSSEAAAAVAPLAPPAHMSLALLAQREGLTNHYVLQTAMTRSQQVDVLARYATRLHWRSFGILGSNDQYGRDFADKFRAAIERYGGRVTWQDFYDHRTREAAAQIARGRERRERGMLDAVFLPDSADAALLLGTALRTAMPDVGLFGPNDWNDPAALEKAGTQLNGAFFVAGFFADSSRPGTRAFVEAFRKAYDVRPDIFAAQAYDAATLLRAALDRGGSTRAAMDGALHAIGPVVGATGEIRVTASGAEHRLFLLRLVAGRLEEITGDDEP